MNLTLHRFDLPTRHPFTIARGTTTVQRTLVVELGQDGLSGFGEAPECAYYGATIERIAATLDRVRPLVEAARADDPAGLWESLCPAVRGRGLRDEPTPDTFAQCALDAAAHDLWGKLHGEPVWRLWGLRLDGCPPSDYTIGIDAIDVMVGKLAEFPGWPVYKIKLGTPHDLEIVRRLREHSGAVFRVDANAAWDVEQTLRQSAGLAALGVELIEQPLPPDDPRMASLGGRCRLPIVADESCVVERDVARCAAVGFDGVNIKLVKCGGLTPARRMIDEARRLGLKVMVGCFTESTVGISAAAQLLPLVDYADLDGAVLLAKDVATGVTLDHGRVVFSPENGCGVRLLATRAETT